MKISDKGKISDGKMPDQITLSQMMNDTLWHPVSFIRKELFTKYGPFDTGFRICGDYDFFFKVIIAKGARTKHVNQFIAVFELNGLSSDSGSVELIKAEKDRVQKTYLSEAEINNFKSQPPMPVKRKGFLSRWFQ
jgi:hypothetical protein